MHADVKAGLAARLFTGLFCVFFLVQLKSIQDY